MSERTTTIANLNACYDSVLDLADGLSDDQLSVQSLCPEWTIHGVLGHLFGLEQVMTGWLPSGPDDPPPFAEMGAAQEAILAVSGEALVDRIRSIADGRRAELEALTDEQFNSPSLTPVGLATYGKFMAIRVFDFWVHEQDMRVPLGVAGHEGGPAAEQSIDEIEGSLGYIVGKKIDLPDGKSITFRLTGPVERTMSVKVDGRAAPVDPIDNPDVEIVADSVTFALLACGRIDPEQPIAEGRITWSGDDELGAHAARNLRYTM